MFNIFLRTVALPREWKTANVVPVHKKGSKDIIGNCRPVWLLCNISKVLEKCVFNYVSPFTKDLIVKAQHGFLDKHNTTTNFIMTFIAKLIMVVKWMLCF